MEKKISQLETQTIVLQKEVKELSEENQKLAKREKELLDKINDLQSLLDESRKEVTNSNTELQEVCALKFSGFLHVINNDVKNEKCIVCYQPNGINVGEKFIKYRDIDNISAKSKRGSTVRTYEIQTVKNYVVSFSVNRQKIFNAILEAKISSLDSSDDESEEESEGEEEDEESVKEEASEEKEKDEVIRLEHKRISVQKKQMERMKDFLEKKLERVEKIHKKESPKKKSKIPKKIHTKSPLNDDGKSKRERELEAELKNQRKYNEELQELLHGDNTVMDEKQRGKLVVIEEEMRKHGRLRLEADLIETQKSLKSKMFHLRQLSLNVRSDAGVKKGNLALEGLKFAANENKPFWKNIFKSKPDNSHNPMERRESPKKKDKKKKKKEARPASIHVGRYHPRRNDPNRTSQSLKLPARVKHRRRGMFGGFGQSLDNKNGENLMTLQSEKKVLERRVEELEFINDIVRNPKAIGLVYGNQQKHVDVRGYLGFVIKKSPVTSASYNEVRFFKEVFGTPTKRGRKPSTVRTFFKKILSYDEMKFIPTYFGSWKSSDATTGEEYFSIAMEKGKYDMKEYVSRSKRIKLSREVFIERLGMIQNCCKAINVLHSHNLVHNDLKPGNLIVVEDQHGGNFSNKIEFLVKLLDFENVKKIPFSRRNLLVGTSRFLDPKSMSIGKGQVDQFALSRDIFSFGHIMNFVVFHQNPFEKFLNYVGKHLFNNMFTSNSLPMWLKQVVLDGGDFIVTRPDGEIGIFEKIKLNAESGDDDALMLKEQIEKCRNEKSFYPLLIDENSINGEFCDKHFIDILKSTFSFDEKKRPSVKEIVKVVENCISVEDMLEGEGEELIE